VSKCEESEEDGWSNEVRTDGLEDNRKRCWSSTSSDAGGSKMSSRRLVGCCCCEGCARASSGSCIGGVTRPKEEVDELLGMGDGCANAEAEDSSSVVAAGDNSVESANELTINNVAPSVEEYDDDDDDECAVTTVDIVVVGCGEVERWPELVSGELESCMVGIEGVGTREPLRGLSTNSGILAAASTCVLEPGGMTRNSENGSEASSGDCKSSCKLALHTHTHAHEHEHVVSASSRVMDDSLRCFDLMCGSEEWHEPAFEGAYQLDGLVFGKLASHAIARQREIQRRRAPRAALEQESHMFLSNQASKHGW